MSAVAATATGDLRPALIGRTFLGPALDYLLIGGGLSLLWTGALIASGQQRLFTSGATMALVLLFANSAHFAASTVRLYARPGASREMPFLTLVLPLLAFVALTAGVMQGERIGRQLYALYLTWSPYHYAAQAYGLAVMYAHRSGRILPQGEKRALRLVCMLPFAFAFVSGIGVGLDWLLPTRWLAVQGVQEGRLAAQWILGPLVMLSPFALWAWLWQRGGRPIPAICLLILFSNGIWWIALPYMQAFVWATVFHGIQYMAIVIVFHVKERMAASDNRHGAAYHALWFYGASLLLAYAIFHLVPQAYVLAGFGRVESLFVAVAIINIHHFVVDAFIWRFSKGGSNRRVVESGAPAPA